MAAVLFDTSIYISLLREGLDTALEFRRLGPDRVLWLSAVVLEELYAGSNRRDRRWLAKLEHDFEKVRRLLAPNQTDWVLTGQVLGELATRNGYEQIGRGRLTNDTLIAMSAVRNGITVVSANQRDFARIASVRPFQWELRRLT